MKRFFSALIILFFVSGCVTVPAPKDYTQFNASNPKSILVVPVVNESMDLMAPNLFLTTISKPVAEQGYYVFPVHLVKRVLEDEGLYDANLVHNAQTTRLAALFGADAVLYITIKKWEARYAVLSTTIVVGLDYVIKDGRTGNTLWKESKTMTYSPNGGSNSGNPLADLVAELVVAACTKAFPDANYIQMAQQTNNGVIATAGQGLPPGKYLIRYQQKKAGMKIDTTAPEEKTATASEEKATETVKEEPVIAETQAEIVKKETESVPVKETASAVSESVETEVAEPTAVETENVSEKKSDPVEKDVAAEESN